MDQSKIESLISQLLVDGLGLDVSDPNLIDTPKRVAKMFTEEVFASLNPQNAPNVKVFPNRKEINEIVLLDNIPYSSTCSHHLVTFRGFAWFAYIPNKTLIGASKVSRVITFLSKKPELQEELCDSIVDNLDKSINPKGCMLVMRGVHDCMANRGVKTGPGAGMITSAVRGCFENLTTKMEALELIKLSVVLKGI